MVIVCFLSFLNNQTRQGWRYDDNVMNLIFLFLYKYRHLVENVFARFKQYRGIVTRYDKLKRNYEGTLALACYMIWLPM